MSDDKNIKVDGPSGSVTITVACKLPHGLLLRLFVMKPTVVDIIGGGKREIMEATNATDITEVVRIKGYAAPRGKPQHGIGGDTGFALTHNVPRKFFEQWMEQNKDSVVVKQHLIFAAADAHRAQDQAEEKVALKNGQEPLDPNNLPRLSRRMKIKKFDPKDDSVAA